MKQAWISHGAAAVAVRQTMQGLGNRRRVAKQDGAEKSREAIREGESFR